MSPVRWRLNYIADQRVITDGDLRHTNLVHGDDLTVSTSSSSSLDPESGTLTWLTNTRERETSHVGTKSLSKTDSSCRFAFTERGGSDTIVVVAIRMVRGYEK